MQDFKKQWEITKNWQLIFPILGLISSIYLGTKLSFKILNQNFILEIIVGILLGILIVKSCIFFINKLEKKWIVNQRWELIRIFLIFALTGSSSLFVGRPFIKLLGISKDNLKSHDKFRDKYKIKFDLLSDEDLTVLKKYKVWAKKKFMGREFMGILRTTFLIDPKGKIIKIWENVKVKDHAKDVLDTLNSIQK